MSAVVAEQKRFTYVNVADTIITPLLIGYRKLSLVVISIN